MKKPLAIDLFCGKGGWTRGLLDAGFDVIGFDIERHADYPWQLVIQDVLTIHGSQLRDAALIVSSSPCQKYSYMAMPWTRAKAMAAWYREDPARQVELNALFNASFRIQREASETAGRHIRLVAENVKGAQPWVGRAKWHYGSFYLWGDVPALMPPARRWSKVPGLAHGTFPAGGIAQGYLDNEQFKGFGGSWFAENHNTNSGSAGNPVNGSGQKGTDGSWFTPEPDGRTRQGHWRDGGCVTRCFNSKDSRRKEASAQIAMIPYPLARWIGEVHAA